MMTVATALIVGALSVGISSAQLPDPGMTIDPDGEHFWYVGEYAGETDNPFANWRTYVSEHTFNCESTPFVQGNKK